VNPCLEFVERLTTVTMRTQSPRYESKGHRYSHLEGSGKTNLSPLSDEGMKEHKARTYCNH
jgi:hypothetical protein